MEDPSGLIRNAMGIRAWIDQLADRTYAFLWWIEGDPEEVEDPEEAFRRAFRVYFPLYLTVYIGVFALLGLDISGCWSFPRQAYGLTFDLVGTVILARGLIQSPAGIIGDSSTYPLGAGAPQSGYIPSSKKAIDAFSGVVFLFTGFTIQGLAVIGWI